MLNFDPPRIIVSERPLRLMLIDGPPVTVPVESTQLEFVVNTDWTVFHHLASDAWYVLDQGSWLRNNMLASGRWFVARELPDDFRILQFGSDWPEVAAAMPPREPATQPLPITLSYEPTELVLIDGSARWEEIAATGLQYVSNTSGDLFRLDGRYYLLLAGRWFSTKDLRRKWHPVRELPASFARIPADHPRARVLAAVAGTEQAQQALREVAESRRQVLDAGAGAGLSVPWFGEPRFVAIEGTALQRAENTPYQVIRHNNFYYLCHEGAWYRSSSPQGPWTTAREVPEAIYGIPATDPAYNVTFVRLESFDDRNGQVAYSSTGGYYGSFSTGATVVYGTGWYYPGFYNRSVYWRYPYAYGYSHSATYALDTREQDWEWSLDGTKRRIYRYGPRNVIGGEYVMPESDGYKGDGRQRRPVDPPDGQ